MKTFSFFTGFVTIEPGATITWEYWWNNPATKGFVQSYKGDVGEVYASPQPYPLGGPASIFGNDPYGVYSILEQGKKLNTEPRIVYFMVFKYDNLPEFPKVNGYCTLKVTAFNL